MLRLKNALKIWEAIGGGFGYRRLYALSKQDGIVLKRSA
jgi:hypothetical protein